MLIYQKLLSSFEQMTNEGQYAQVLKKAFKLYSDQMVQKLNVYDQLMVNGIVKDIEMHAVVLDFDHFRYSSCTCQQPTFCEHMAALFFQYCRSLENGKVLAEQAYFQLLGLVHASKNVKPVQAELSLTSDPRQIFQMFHEKFADEWKKCRHSFHPLSQTLTAMKGIAKSNPYEQQRLHWAASILYVLYLGERALLAVDSFSRYYHEMSFKRVAEPWISQLHDLMQELQNQPKLNDMDISWLKAMMNFSFEQSFKFEKPAFEWDYHVYRLVDILAKVPQEHQSIKEDMEGLITQETNPFVQTIIRGALAICAISEHDDHLAIQYLQKAQFEKVQRIIYPTVEKRMASGNWTMVMEWMTFLEQHFQQTGQIRSIGPFLQLCQKASQLQATEPKWQQYMVNFLPHSYSMLSEHLLNMKQYKQWADLQIYMGRRPEDFKANELQLVEKVEPAVLLPLYHQAIDILIESRNRQSYRLAAKHLRKLKGIYSELHAELKWRAYLRIIQQKYSRLRAFQEELLKGKILG